jgi:hypothetical protein
MHGQLGVMDQACLNMVSARNDFEQAGSPSKKSVRRIKTKVNELLTPAVTPPKPRSGTIASGARSRIGPTGPYLGTATVTLSSPQKSTPFCDEN